MSKVEIDFNVSRINFRLTSDLIIASAWGAGRTDEINRRAFDRSLCAAAYVDGEQVGFGRAITDYTVMAYIADVMVWPDRRGEGIGKQLVQSILDHPELASVVHFSLTTVDAHGLYARFGFEVEGRYMRLDR